MKYTITLNLTHDEVLNLESAIITEQFRMKRLIRDANARNNPAAAQVWRDKIGQLEDVRIALLPY